MNDREYVEEILPPGYRVEGEFEATVHEKPYPRPQGSVMAKKVDIVKLPELEDEQDDRAYTRLLESAVMRWERLRAASRSIDAYQEDVRHEFNDVLYTMINDDEKLSLMQQRRRAETSVTMSQRDVEGEFQIFDQRRDELADTEVSINSCQTAKLQQRK